MRNKWIIASILIVVLLTLCAASLFAVWQGFHMAQAGGFSLRVQRDNVKAESVEEKTLKVSGPVNLTLNNDFGNISVASGADGQVHIKAEKTGWGPNEAEAQKALESLKLNIEQNGNSIQVSAQLPEPPNTLIIGPIGGSVKFTITVPEEAAITLDSTNGDLVLSGTKGNADLHTDFGGIDVSDVSGVVTVNTKNGNILAENILSDAFVSLTSEFGNITAHGIRGADLTVDSTNGVLDLQGMTASGLLKATSDFGSLSLTDGQASSLDIKSTNGKVTLENLIVEDKVTVYNDFGDLTLNSVDAGAYDLKTKNGKIELDQARGSIKAQSDFGDVEVLNVENGMLDLSSTNGAVTFSGSLAAGPHKLSSDFGNITLTLPADSALNVDLQTDFGKISSDFEITVSGALESNHWVGKFNGGGEELNVKTKNGNITINSK
jgi:DUF4097 and DUF4098 domain-containing protein YvlB